ncbi:hypothetical protein ANANG_G00277780 [Anguilla anguilla]|uniref:Uncharacterized protein n=1 Tax=Anguilla anguilla TaxID=7936 RepID=A0A9D3LNJ3_ANGAN|nr:hypothetical protein ANANG_G00277780 [Anguilla anguilla]
MFVNKQPLGWNLGKAATVVALETDLKQTTVLNGQMVVLLQLQCRILKFLRNEDVPSWRRFHLHVI